MALSKSVLVASLMYMGLSLGTGVIDVVEIDVESGSDILAFVLLEIGPSQILPFGGQLENLVESQQIPVIAAKKADDAYKGCQCRQDSFHTDRRFREIRIYLLESFFLKRDNILSLEKTPF